MNRLCRTLLLGTVVLAGCADRAPLSGQAQADAETRAACRQRAEAVYDQQNRGAIYSPSSQVNTPYSANYLPDQTDSGLSQIFIHDQIVSDCIRNTGTGAERSAPQSGQPSTVPSSSVQRGTAPPPPAMQR